MYTLQINQKAPDFSLKATDGKFYQLDNFNEAKILIIFFSCNHCPYVLKSDADTKLIAEKYILKNVTFVAINSNSPNIYELDSYPNMIERMEQYNFPWTYLYDESQETVLKYGGLCTPHFFVFNRERKLKYTGRAVDSPKDISLVKSRDLEKAIDELLAGAEVSTPITNPIGCNIKWDGKPKHWMPEDAVPLI